MEKEIYERALNLCCDRSEVRPQLQKPFMQEGMAIGTDGRVLLYVKDVEVEYDNTLRYPNACQFYKPDTDVLGYIKFAPPFPDEDAFYKYGKAIMKGERMQTIFDVAGMLGCQYGKVVRGYDESNLTILLDNDRVCMYVMRHILDDMRLATARTLLAEPQDTSSNEQRAEEYYQFYQERLAQEEREEEARQKAAMKVYEVEITIRKSIYVEAPDTEEAECLASEYVQENDLLDDWDCYSREVSLDTLAAYHADDDIVVQGCEVNVTTYLAERAENE